jgi:hypothetical protein
MRLRYTISLRLLLEQSEKLLFLHQSPWVVHNPPHWLVAVAA